MPDDVLADVEATRKRVERDAAREMKAMRGKLVVDLLPVLDNLGRSLTAAVDSPDPQLREGVRIVRDQFEQVLRDYGIEVIEAQDAVFDPAEHEAVALVPVDDPDAHRKVIQVVRPGYRHDGQLLRATQVAVGDYRAEAEEPAEGDEPKPVAA